MAFFLLEIHSQNPWMLIAVTLLAAGHIGPHLARVKQIQYT